MSEKVQRYRQGSEPLPASHRKWLLFGAGFENLGVDGHTTEAPLPTYGPDEILVRNDAVGLCFSDLKVIKAGQEHPRIIEDMRTKPVVLGHEIALTVVGVGANRRDQFKVGQRFVVQADVFYKGVSLAVGYVIPGGLQQYNVFGKEVLDGDEGCYLLPLQPQQGYAAAALSEPWACVESAYVIEYRDNLKPGGAAWFFGAPSAGRYTLSRGFDDACHPRVVVLTDVSEDFKSSLAIRAAELGVKLIEVNGLQPTEFGRAAEAAGVKAFDDCILMGPHPASHIAPAMALTAFEGAFILASTEPYAEAAPVDVGRLHYERMLLGGTDSPDISAAYHKFDRQIKPGGVIWVIGAAGPMGHMHVQRALELGARGPRRVIASDLLPERLAVVERKFGPLARRNHVDLVCLADPQFTPEAFKAKLLELTDGQGPDYIVVLAPVPAVVARAYNELGAGGVLNVFAGLNRGTTATLDVNAVRDARQLRIIGSSGSSIADLRLVLRKSLDGSLSPEQTLAAVTGLEGAREGLEGMSAQRFPGKVVVFPQAVNLPLTTLDEMPEKMPEIAAKLGEGQVWTSAAEEALLEKYLKE